MKETILKQNLNTEFYTDEKCFITELSNMPDDPDASIARARVRPGISTRWHHLRDTIERYYIISGTGIVEIGEMSPQILNPGDTVLIPSRCRQRITNNGAEDLIFLAICTPRFKPEAYVDIEKDTG